MIKPLVTKIIQIGAKRGIILCCIATTSPIHAQVVPDTTLPVNSSITSQENTDIITGGTQAGSNLFHSFEHFSVPTGTVAYFNNSLDVQNIIGRVTGRAVSNIDGKIQANGTANLFLLNPNGIVFGSNATLNIGGSFIASTASSLNFADGKFSATAPQATPLLSVNVPIGLQFGQSVGSIQVQGDGQGVITTTDYIDIGALSGRPSSVGSSVQTSQSSTGLSVQPNQTLAMVGGDVVLEGGTLKTSGGRIELGSVGDSSFVNLTQIDKGYALGYQGVSALKDIQLSQKAAVNASGAGGGNIQVQGRRVTVASGSQIEATTLAGEPGNTLNIHASESLDLTGSSNDGKYFSGAIARVAPQATGNGGNLNIETSRLSVRNGGIIATSTRGEGQGGSLRVKVSQGMEVSGFSANGQIPSGLFTTTELQASGNGGNLIIDTGRLSVSDRAVIVTATTSKSASGNLDITANGVQINGGLLSAATINEGKAGNLNIETNELTAQNQARVSVASRESGQAGNIQIAANSIKLDNGSSITAAGGVDSGGNIQLQVQDLLLLQRQSKITAESRGDGGNLRIDTNLLAATENSTLNANAVGGKGGNIEIEAEGLYISPSPDSQITATSERGTQFNGVVEINSPDLEFNSALVSLPVDVVDVSRLVATGCRALPSTSQFIVTGRGGLPPTPREAFASESPLVDLGTPSNQNNRPIAIHNSITNVPTPIVEAQGWIIGDKGEVILVNYQLPINNEQLTINNCQ